MKNTIFLSLLMLFVCQKAIAHGGGLNSLGCHNNNKTGDYHCHGSGSSSSTSPTSSDSEDAYNAALASKIGGDTEVTYNYTYGLAGNQTFEASIRVDIVTNEYVIEGGKDKRSSLDSIQQAVFASTVTNKKPAVAIYDTDGRWGKYEHRIWAAAQDLGIRFIWFSGGRVVELSN